ncbi:MAG: YbaK/EbsC family protein [Gemmataceae bacterium]|nr:YbaK/EbsC family protein [Gemmataceae bacterium]
MFLSQFLADQHVAFETMLHPPAFTAQKLAKFLHIPGRQVVKCVVLITAAGPVLAVLPAPWRVNLDRVRHGLRTDVRLAGEAEVIELFRDCERGSLTPFGRLYGLTTILEAALAPETLIVFEAQSHGVAIRMRCRDFEMLEQPRRLAFAEEVRTPRRRGA